MATHNSYLERRGFVGNPFASTNSETEPRLSEYFVPPPYFESVLGSPESPKSTIVFAPRGTGKTAQRRMIEDGSVDGGFVCVTYVDFSGIDPKGVTLDGHLSSICRLVTIAALGHLDSDVKDLLSDHQRQVLKYCAERYLSTLNQQEFTTAIQAVKSLGDKASDAWRKYGSVVAAALSILMKKAGVDDVTIPLEMRERGTGNASTDGYLFAQLVSLLQSAGFSALYILVDKVDETAETGGNAAVAFDLIRPLVLHLPTLENPGVAFKFFLWDQTESHFVDAGGRSDRLGVARLHWTVSELSEMLRRRMMVFSNGQVDSFNSLVDPRSTLDVHALLAYLCRDSPRDLIRMAEQIVSEHTRSHGASDFISESTVLRGVVEFSQQRTNELYGQYRADLARLPEPSFIINKLASDVFRVSTQSVRSKVQKWVAAGAVEKIGEIPNAGNRPLHLYAVTDLRIAIATARTSDVALLLDNYALECPDCGEILITAQSEAVCTRCGGIVHVRDARSLLDICQRQPPSA